MQAFGQELKEADNYNRFLGRAKEAGTKVHFKGGAVIAIFFFFIFMVYGYAFYMGSVWIMEGFYNPINDGPYTSGDVLSCFFGVIFGMFSLGMAHPNIKAVAEGRVAGKMAFDIIDRVP